MSKLYNRARVTVSSTGTGTLTLSTAVAGYQTFTSAGVQNGDVVSYVIEDGLNWEVGEGTYTSSTNTLTRTVTQSFNGSTYGTAAISVTSSAQVFISPLAADLIANGSNNTLSVTNGGTGLTSLTAGRIPFGAGTSAFGNSANLFWDSANARLGIGTASPAAVLHATLASTASLIIGFNNTSANYYDANAHYFRSGTAGTLGNIDSTGQLNFSSLNAYKGTSPNLAGILTAFGGASENYYDANLHVFRSGGTAERMRIDASGNVGIGTTSPSSKLHINSASNTAASITSSTTTQYGGPALSLYNTNASMGGVAGVQFQTGTLDASATQGYFVISKLNYSGSFVSNILQYNLTSNYWLFLTDGAERMRLDASGNVGIGTTAFGTSAATVLAIATGTAPTTGPADTIQIFSTDLSAGNTMLSLRTEGTPVNANTTAATTHRIAIRVNGTVYYLLANTAA